MYSYSLYVCACRRICVFQKLYTDLKTIVFHFCFSHGFNKSNFNCSLVFAASLQHSAESTCAFGLLPSAAETILDTNGGLVAIDTDRYHILQRVGGHWTPVVQITTNVGSRWEKSEFRL